MKKPVEVGGRHELFAVEDAVGDRAKENPRGEVGCLWGSCDHKEMPEMLRRECGARKCWRDKARSRGEVEGCRILVRPTVLR